MARAIVNEIKDTRKNYIINGDMQIAQRGTSFAGIGAATYHLDRWRYDKSGAVVHTVSQDTDVPTLAQAGYLFQNSLRANLTTPDTSIAPGDYCIISQMIEGYNYAAIAQKTFTLSFWVKATTPGTYCVAFQNSTPDRSYISEYTINSAATWEYKTITVTPSPSAGTWNYTNGVGLRIHFVVSGGSTYQNTAGSWLTGNYIATSNQINGTNTGATDFRLAGVMVNEGSTAPLFRTFSNSSSAAELQVCQRYYEKSFTQGTAPAQNAGRAGVLRARAYVASYGIGLAYFKATKRSGSFTITTYNPNNTNSNWRNIDANTDAAVLGFGDSSDTILHIECNAMTANNTYEIHWTAECEL